MVLKSKAGWCVLAGLALGMVTPATQATLIRLDGYATSGYGPYGPISDTFNGSLSPTGPATTGVHSTTGTASGGSVHSSAGEARVNLPAGTIGLWAASNATSALPPATNYFYSDGSSAEIYYAQWFNVTSSSQPVGTPVTITVSIQIAWAASHTIGPIPSSNNYNLVQLSLGAGVGDSFYHSELTAPTQYTLDSNSNQYYSNTNGGSMVNGVFNNGTGHVDFTIHAEVGDQIDLAIDPKLRYFDQIYSPSDVQTTATGFAAMGVAFGASATADLSSNVVGLFNVVSDVTLTDSTSGFTLPGTENATYENALAAMPIPEPASGAVLLAAGLVSLRPGRRKSMRL